MPYEHIKDESQQCAIRVCRSNLEVVASNVAECSAQSQKLSLDLTQVFSDNFYDIVNSTGAQTLEDSCAEIKDYHRHAETMVVVLAWAQKTWQHGVLHDQSSGHTAPVEARRQGRAYESERPR